MKSMVLPQHVRVALSIAARITKGEWTELQKLPSAKSLAVEYETTAENVRKAFHVLSGVNIISLQGGSNYTVLSESKAREYLKAIELRREQKDLRNKFQSLFNEYESIGRQMEEIGNQLLEAYINPLPSEDILPTFEVEVAEYSNKIGKSINELRFWQETGVTVAAVKRGQYTEVSPGPYIRLRANDIIVCVGTPDARNDVENYLNGNQDAQWRSPARDNIGVRVSDEQLKIVAEALHSDKKDIRNITMMSKGMTNHSFMFTCKGKKYILRIPGEGTENLINREQEEEVYLKIQNKGLCDDLIYMSSQNGIKIAPFLEDVRNCDPYSKTDITKSMALLRKLHELNIQVGHEFNLFERIEFYENLWGDQPSIWGDYAETKECVFKLRKYVEAHRDAYCLAHIDAVPDNFLFYKRNDIEQLQLTDWEYAGMQDPHVDIAMFCIYSMYKRNEIDQLIDLYFEGNCSRETRIKIYCYIAICGLLWSNWCEYKYHLGVDYSEYARRQYLYAKDYYLLATKEMQEL